MTHEVVILSDKYPPYRVEVSDWGINDPLGFVMLVHANNELVEFIPTTAIRSVLVPNLHTKEQSDE